MIAGNIPGKTQTASVAIYDAVQAGRDNEALTLAVIVSAIAVAMLYFITRFSRLRLKKPRSESQESPVKNIFCLLTGDSEPSTPDFFQSTPRKEA